MVWQWAPGRNRMMFYASDSVDEISVCHSIYPDRYPWPSTAKRAAPGLLRVRRSLPPPTPSAIVRICGREARPKEFPEPRRKSLDPIRVCF